MDYKYICSKEGYRREDLTEQQREVLEGVDFVLNSIRDLKDNLDFVDDGIDEETALGKVKAEIYNKVIDAVLDWAESSELELQIALAESEDKADAE